MINDAVKIIHKDNSIFVQLVDHLNPSRAQIYILAFYAKTVKGASIISESRSALIQTCLLPAGFVLCSTLTRTIQSVSKKPFKQHLSHIIQIDLV